MDWSAQEAKFGGLKFGSEQQPQKENKKKSWITSLIPAAGSILGGIAGSFAAPGVGTAAGGAAGGVLGKKLQDLITGDHSSVASYLGEGALGSLGGLGEGLEAARGAGAALKAGEGAEGALQALRFGTKGAEALKGVEGASAAEKAIAAGTANATDSTGNIIGKTGSELRQSVINPKVASGVGSVQKEAAIANEVKNVPGLTAAAKAKNLPKAISDIGVKIDPILEKSTGTVPTSDLLDTIRANAEQSPHFLAGDSGHETQLNKVLTDLGAKTGGSTDLTARQLFDYKKGMDMNSVFTKLEKGADLNPKEASRLAVWSSLDKAITKAEPAVKDLTKQQSLLMQGAKGLDISRTKSAGIPLLGIKSQKAEQAIQAGKELLGRGAEKVGGVAGAEAPSTVSGLIGRTAKNMAKAQAIPRVLQLAGEQTPQQDSIQPDPAQTLDANGQPITDAATPDSSIATPVDESTQIQQGLRAAALQALAAGDTKGLANITAAASMFANQDKASASTLTKTQQTTVDNANTASSTLDTMLQQLKDIGGGAGRIGGLVGSVKGKLGLDNKVSAFNSTKVDAAIALAQALSGSTRVPPPSTLKLLEDSMPNYDDNPEEAQRKVDILQQRLSSKLSTIPGAGA